MAASTTNFPPLPPAFKPLQHFLKIASEHDKRDPVVSYYCRLYTLQLGMKIDRKSKEAVAVLTSLMDHLEQVKRGTLAEEEAVRSEVVGQAHIETYALRMFAWADAADRRGDANKNVVKSFYTAGMLFDALQTFGELTDEVEEHRKYAKWKAAYIHNCLKNGEVPIPGPMAGEEEEEDSASAGGAGGSESRPSDFLSQPGGGVAANRITPGAHAPPTTPSDPPHQAATGGSHPVPRPRASPQPTPAAAATYVEPEQGGAGGGVRLSPDDFARAHKLCKFACSALQYEDVPSAVDNLQRCLRLLNTGSE